MVFDFSLLVYGILVVVLLVFVLVARICLWAFIVDHHKSHEFSPRLPLPPISDEEFVALCKPGTNPDIAIKVRHIVSEQLNVPAEEIYPTDRLVEDLGAD